MSKVTITLDFTPLVKAFQQIGYAARHAAEAFRNWNDTFMRDDLYVRRVTYGGMEQYALIWPDQYLTVQCAGMLCSIEPCPSDEHDLQCSHSCHQKGKQS